jgi:hypothetical protein
MGNGAGTATYTVDANTSTSSRSGFLSVAGQWVTINQAAATAPTAPSNLRVMIK